MIAAPKISLHRYPGVWFCDVRAHGASATDAGIAFERDRTADETRGAALAIYRAWCDWQQQMARRERER